jgi:hypothetical protein
MKAVLRTGLAIVALGWAGHASPAVRRTLSTKFVEMLIEGIPIGSRYVLEGKNIEVLNDSEVALRLRYDARIPQPADMRPGYEPIPDSTWISFEPRNFEVNPTQTASGKLVIFIPDDPALVGKRFQVMLHIHSDASEGGMMAIGLMPRLMFSIAGKEQANSPPKVVSNPSVLARMTPFETASDGAWILVPCGTFKVENNWSDPITYEVLVDPGAVKRIDMRADETLLPDPSWLEISPPVVVLPRTSRTELAATARLPFSSEHFGKVYVAALRTVAKRKGQRDLEIYNKVRIVVPKVVLSATATGSVKGK